MRPHLQPLFPCLAAFFSVWQDVDFVNILARPSEDARKPQAIVNKSRDGLQAAAGHAIIDA